MSNTTSLKRKVAKKILVVEDDGKIGLALDMTLNEREYLERYKPSLIILDNQLPDGFGVDFISYIRKKYPSIKIIMISGFGAARDVALENGADMFFEKPFSLDEFDNAINQLLL